MSDDTDMTTETTTHQKIRDAVRSSWGDSIDEHTFVKECQRIAREMSAARTAEAAAQVFGQARQGCDRCYCGCKYWEFDKCVDCGTHISECMRDPEWVAENR